MEIVAKYRRKQIFILSLIFLICATLIFIAEYSKEKNLLLKNLNRDLLGYSDLIDNYLVQHNLENNISVRAVDSFIRIIPEKNIRITIIDFDGKVMYDSRVGDVAEMENHLQRPEIIQALGRQTGSDIRVSKSTSIKYYYLAKKYKSNFIRVSIEYNISASQLLEPEKFPILSILLMFFVSTIIMVLVSDKYGKSLNMLRRFTEQASNNQTIEDVIKFPKTELGNIGQEIVDIYDKLNSARSDLISEKEKLVRHLNMLEEGIAIYSKDKKIVANNSFFIQYISLISDNKVFSPENFFEIDAFAPLLKFIDSQSIPNVDLSGKHMFYEINVNMDSRIFSAKSIVFQDKSIEIIITDITRPARRRILKQQLTENIAHELKTPVSSIKGYLETILDLKPDKEKLFYFLKKAHSQTCRLTNLINDISMLTKIEEAGNLYQLEKVNLLQLVNNVIDDVDLQLKENKIDLKVNISSDIEFDGNSILLYSVFRNLFDNTISYAGKNLEVKIENYLIDKDFYYFSYSDSGVGVPELDLARLFERFYRVDKGRDHQKGGTGLGLAIVKNAILFHKGEISVKNKKEGGLEFLFSFKKKLEID